MVRHDSAVAEQESLTVRQRDSLAVDAEAAAPDGLDACFLDFGSDAIQHGGVRADAPKARLNVDTRVRHLQEMQLANGLQIVIESVVSDEVRVAPNVPDDECGCQYTESGHRGAHGDDTALKCSRTGQKGQQGGAGSDSDGGQQSCHKDRQGRLLDQHGRVRWHRNRRKRRPGGQVPQLRMLLQDLLPEVVPAVLVRIPLGRREGQWRRRGVVIGLLHARVLEYDGFFERGGLLRRGVWAVLRPLADALDQEHTSTDSRINGELSHSLLLAARAARAHQYSIGVLVTLRSEVVRRYVAIATAPGEVADVICELIGCLRFASVLLLLQFYEGYGCGRVGPVVQEDVRPLLPGCREDLPLCVGSDTRRQRGLPVDLMSVQAS